MGILAAIGSLFATIGSLFAKGGTWLLKNPAILFAVIFCGAFIFVVHSKNEEISTLAKAGNKKDAIITNMTGALAVSRANVATLSNSLQTQNESLDALKNQGVTATAKFDQLITAMNADNATTAKKIAAIDAAKPGADKCASAFELVRSSVK